MRVIGFTELKNDERLTRFTRCINPWFTESLYKCLSLCALELEPGEIFFSEGAACILALGGGKVDDKQVESASTFGFIREKGNYTMINQMFKAKETSILLCYKSTVFHGTCFGFGCESTHYGIRCVLDEIYSENNPCDPVVNE